MNKRVILFFAGLFGILGSYIPVLLGDTNLFDAWSVLGGFIGGVFGIWVGAYLAKKWS